MNAAFFWIGISLCAIGGALNIASAVVRHEYIRSLEKLVAMQKEYIAGLEKRLTP